MRLAGMTPAAAPARGNEYEYLFLKFQFDINA
jgi:hypothetical protein